jgi:hypothetical protein
MTTICLHPKTEQTILDWFENRTSPAVFLIGPPGVGKTTLAYRVMQNQKLRVSEFNASHIRSGACFRKIILPLLKRGGIIHQTETGKPGGLGVLLDEIDGLSNGEKGGLDTLLNYLKEWKPDVPGLPMILISNTIQQRKLQTISRYCLTIHVGAAEDLQIQELLGRPAVPDAWKANGNGDLRPLLRGEFDQRGASEDGDEFFYIPEGVVPISKWCLYSQLDPYLNLEMDNNDNNLVGLVIAENLPERLEGVLGDTRKAWDVYCKLFDSVRESDYADYWAYFYQTWRLLPLSQDVKLNTMNLWLSREAPWTQTEPDLKTIRYTPVLTKQSALFNAWRMLCDIADTTQIPIRLTPMALVAAAATEGAVKKAEKKKKVDSMSLLSVFLGEGEAAAGPAAPTPK